MEVREIRLEGRLGSDSLPVWVRHRAGLLNLSGWLDRADAEHARIVVAGPGPMIEAMEVSCSLGPADVMVEQISSSPLWLDDIPQGFSIQ